LRLQKTIERSMSRYPSLYASRTGVLDHMYCVIGGGHEWIDGEIRYDRERRRRKGDPREAFRPFRDVKAELAWKKLVGERVSSWDLEWTRESVKHHNEQAKLILDNIKVLSRTHDPRTHYYPLSQYSHIMNVPDNVRTDYLKGALEVVGLILRTPKDHKDRCGWSTNHNLKKIEEVRPRLIKMALERNLSPYGIIESILMITVTDSERSRRLFGRARTNHIRSLLGMRQLKDPKAERMAKLLGL
jgi:hypothetical protein